MPTFQSQASRQEVEIHAILIHVASVIKRYKGNTCWICHHRSCPHGGCSMCGVAFVCRPLGLRNVHSGAGLWPSAGPSVLWRIQTISLQITSGEVEGSKSLWKKHNDSVPRTYISTDFSLHVLFESSLESYSRLCSRGSSLDR